MRLKLIAFAIVMLAGTVLLYGQSWQNPWTASTGVVVTAAQLNQTRDNLSVLRSGGIAMSGQAANDLVYATSSTQFGRVATGTGVLTANGGEPSWTLTPSLTSLTTTTGVQFTGVGAAAEALIAKNANTLAFFGGSSGFGFYNSGGGLLSSIDTSGNFSTIGRYGSATLQPGFLAYNSSTDACGGGSCTVDFDSEAYDTASNFSSDMFTAPVTGHYLLCANVRVVETGGSTAGVSLTIDTVQADYRVAAVSLTSGQIVSLNGCIIAPMNATDTAFVNVSNSGTVSAAGSSLRETTFSGRLMP